METLGRHVIAEMDGCEAGVLSNSALIERYLREAADQAGATRLTDEFFEFRNGGVSGFVLLAESHISIHTWPEHGYAAVDIYTCGNHTVPERACRYLGECLGATKVRTSILDRGLEARGGGHDHVIAQVARAVESARATVAPNA